MTSATSSTSHGFTRNAPDKDGDTPVNSETIKLDCLGNAYPSLVAFSSSLGPCLHVTYSHGARFMPPLVTLPRSHPRRNTKPLPSCKGTACSRNITTSVPAVPLISFTNLCTSARKSSTSSFFARWVTNLQQYDRFDQLRMFPQQRLIGF